MTSTIATSSGCSRSHRQRLSTTQSISTASVRNASHVAQLMTTATVFNAPLTSLCSMAMAGTTSRAATSIGHCKPLLHPPGAFVHADRFDGRPP